MKLEEVLSPSFRDYQKPTQPMVVISTDSDFCQEVVARGWLTREQMAHAAERYRLGRSKSGRCIFWMIDRQGVVRDGHIGDAWASQMLKQRESQLLDRWHAEHCLFGLHALPKEQRAVAAVVERERTAVIMSELFPQYVWLASGYPSNLTPGNLEALQGCSVILFPRTDPTMTTYCSCLELADVVQREYGLHITVSSLLEDHATPEQKAAQIDLLDYLLSHTEITEIAEINSFR